MNTDDEGQVKHQKDLKTNRKNQLIESIQAVMKTREGRRVMWWILEQAGVYRSSFTGNSTTFFNEGKRIVGLDLLTAINKHALGDSEKMSRENRK
jgi:hypothetical protein